MTTDTTPPAAPVEPVVPAVVAPVEPVTAAAPDPEDFDAAWKEVVDAVMPEAPAPVPIAKTPEPAAVVPPVEPAVPVATAPASDVTPPAPPAVLPSAPAPVVPAAPAPAPAAPAQPAETPAQKTAREAQEAELAAMLAPYKYTPEQEAAIAEFKKEYPGSAAALDAHLAVLRHEHAQEVYKTSKGIVDYMNRQFAQLAPAVQNMTAQQHFSAVRAAHPDFDVAMPKVEAWIKTQPAYRQGAMQQVFDGGSTEDVIGLFAEYKAATTTPAAPAAVPVAPAVPVKPPATPAEAAALTVPTSKRVTPSAKGVPDKNNFDEAWAEPLQPS